MYRIYSDENGITLELLGRIGIKGWSKKEVEIESADYYSCL